MSFTREEQALINFMAENIEASPNTHQQIAEQVGWGIKNLNMVSMVKKGRSNISLKKVPAFADAIGVPRSKLMRLVLAAYMPEAAEAIIECLSKESQNK